MAHNKTAKMREKEKEFDEGMETLLPRLVNEMGHVKAGEHLGVSHGTINRWLLLLGYISQVVPVQGSQWARL